MIRILPRDAFNDANLLKCIAKLTMDIEDGLCDFIQYHFDGDGFNIVQDEASGGTYVANVQFWTMGRDTNKQLTFVRPLNSRDPWPLWLETDDEAFEVFDDEGNIILTEDML